MRADRRGWTFFASLPPTHPLTLIEPLNKDNLSSNKGIVISVSFFDGMASSPPSSRLERLPRKSHGSSPYAPGQSDSTSLLPTGADVPVLSTSSSGVEQRQTQAPSRLPTLVGLDHSRDTLPSNPAPNTSHGRPDSPRACRPMRTSSAQPRLPPTVHAVAALGQQRKISFSLPQ